MTFLSPFLMELAEVIGEEAAKSLAEQFGGVRWYIPKKPKLTHRFTQVIGLEAMGKLCARYGGGSIGLPRAAGLGAFKQRILSASGSVREIALQLGCTERYVSRVLGMVKPR